MQTGISLNMIFRKLLIIQTNVSHVTQIIFPNVLGIHLVFSTCLTSARLFQFFISTYRYLNAQNGVNNFLNNFESLLPHRRVFSVMALSSGKVLLNLFLVTLVASEAPRMEMSVC